MKPVFQLYRLWLCLNCGDEIVKRDMDKAKEPFVIPIISISIVDTDLNGASGVNGAATISLNLYCVKTKVELTCDKAARPRDTPYQNHD
jgi:hypothetical protein